MAERKKLERSKKSEDFEDEDEYDDIYDEESEDGDDEVVKSFEEEDDDEEEDPKPHVRKKISKSEPDEDTDSAISEIIDLVAGTVVTFNTARGKKNFDIGKLFLINENNLTAEFSTQAASYAFFSILIANSERLVAKRDLIKDQEYSKADDASRIHMTATGEKYTEAVIKSMVLQNANYQLACERFEDARYELNLLKSIVRAYEQKATMLQSLGNHLRSEYIMTGMNTADIQTTNAISAVKESISKRRKNKS